VGVAAMAVLLGTGLITGCTADEPEPPPPSPVGSAPAVPPGGAPAPAGTGVRNPFGAHWDWSRHDRFAPYLGKLAGSATYAELTWCDVERTPGRLDWSRVDRIADRSRELGITLHLKIRTGTCWATGGTARYTRGAAGKTESRMPADLAAYRRFVRGVVARYAPRGVHEYAVENEVNSPSYWAGSPEEYQTLVRAAAETIRAADPQGRVGDSGISSVAYGMGVADRLLRAGREADAVAAYRAYFQRRIGTRGQQIPEVTDAARLRDVLATPTAARSLRFLAATEELLADGTVDIRQLHFYEHFTGVPPLLDYLRARTPAGTPIQAWEVGQFWEDGDGDAASRAAELVKTVTQLVAGGIDQLCWLPLAYNPNNRAGAEVRYGLLDPDGTEREAGRALASLAEAARDATVAPLPPDAAAVLAGVAFTRGGSTTLVLWSATGAPVTVPAAATAESATVGAPPRVGGPTTITAIPVLLRADRPVADLLAGVGR